MNFRMWRRAEALSIQEQYLKKEFQMRGKGFYVIWDANPNNVAG
jgi:hypothetical protein